MRVLLIHNFYNSSSPSGEDVVFMNEFDLLKKNGINVKSYTKHNDEILSYGLIRKYNVAFKNTWSWETYREIKELIRREKVDICHLHNIFYLISPSAYFACKEYGVTVVQTLHNFRMFCANGLLLRDGRVCEECIGKWPWKCIIHGCYRDSRIYSLPVALMQGFHRFLGTWHDKVDAYIALTDFAKRKFIESGTPQEKLFVKPNFMEHIPLPPYHNDNFAIFIGRLSAEKGLRVLINAWEILHSTYQKPYALKIVGDGPLKEDLEIDCKKKKLTNIEFLGRKNSSDSIELLNRASFMIIPSLWYEGFPMVIVEAFGCGKPVIASHFGSLSELIEDKKTGVLFEPGNARDLALKINWMVEHQNFRIEMGRSARAVFEDRYIAEKNFTFLMDIYHKAIENNKVKYESH